MQSKGRLAQSWLERLLDMQEATRSSRVPPIFMLNAKFQMPKNKVMFKIDSMWNLEQGSVR